MQEFVVTFRNGDPDRSGCFAVIQAESLEEAHLTAFAKYGDNWSRAYPSREAAGVEQWALNEIPWGT